MKSPLRFAWLFVLIFLALGILIQYLIFLSWDVSWLLLATHRFLEDGTYFDNFFENNPPMIIYLYVVPEWLANKLDVNHIILFRIWIFLLAGLSLGFSECLMQQLFDQKPHEKIIHAALLTTLAFCYFLLPAYEFGQREHLMLLLVMPYLLTMAVRSSRSYISETRLLIVGLLAGFGFAIKPYFLITFILIEGYFWISSRRWLAWLRIETATIFLVILFYLVSIYTVTPTYIREVFPLVIWSYLTTSYDSWFDLWINTLTPSCIIAFVGYFILYRKLQFKSLVSIFWIALIGFFISYLIQRKFWYYHLYPAVAMSTLLLVIYLTELFFQKEKKQSIHFIYMCIMTLTLLLSPILTLLRFDAFHIRQYLSKTSPMNQLISITKKYADGKYVYFFSDTVVPASTVIDYSGAISASRFPRMWLLPGILYFENKKNRTTQEQRRLDLAKNVVLNAVTEDFQRYHPELVFVNNEKEKAHLGYSFHYISFFSQSHVFQKMWSQYRLIGQYAGYDIYRRFSVN